MSDTAAIHAMLHRQIIALWSHGDLDVVEAMYAADCVDHMPVPGQASGRAGLRQAVQLFRAAMPDLALVLDHTLARGTPDDGWGVDVWHLTGTHSGAPLFGMPASGRRVAFSGIDWLRLRGGMVSALWHVEDMALMAEQLAMPVPPPPPLRPLPPAPLPPAPLLPTGADAATAAAASAHLAARWGRDSQAALPARLRAAAPDLALHIAAWLVDGPPVPAHVAVRGVLAGTHTGAPLFGQPAHGRPFAIDLLAVMAVGRDGVTTRAEVADQLALRGQIAPA